MSGGGPPERAARVDPAGRLQALAEQMQAGNPDLYRNLALYLQVLRQVLPTQVERACFQLATQLQPRRYAAIPDPDRLQLHRRIQSLVQRCASLLTVEQLCSLAAQMARKQHRQERRQRQELLHRLAVAAPPLPAPGDAGAQGARESALPEGSVQLGMALPLTADPFRGVGGWPEAGLPGVDPFSDGDPEDDEESEDPAAEAGDPFARFAQSGDGEPDGEPSSWIRPDPWSEGQLPQDPITLLAWIDGLEQALMRRLRNLSHAINVELLRHGLSGTLLPVALLDAVLAGQLEPKAAPANLLRLQLPFGAEAAEGPLQALAVLMRPSDLELEEPRLRTCRRRLQQHRQEVRRMAQQYRRLQRWREAHESEQLWLQDLKASRTPPT